MKNVYEVNNQNWIPFKKLFSLSKLDLDEDINQWTRIDKKVLIDLGYYRNCFKIKVIKTELASIEAEDWSPTKVADSIQEAYGNAKFVSNTKG